MGKTKPIRTNYTRSGSTVTKGRMLEKLVASMHNFPGIKIKRNVQLPPAKGTGETREIDVLLSTEVPGGYPVRWAIECKNEKSKTTPAQIDAFYGKLHYLGIPTQNGIFVSAAGFTKAAIERALRDDIRPLIYDDVTTKLSETLAQAVQATVYLLAHVNRIYVENFEAGPMRAQDMAVFYDAQGKIIGNVLHSAWEAWINGVVPRTIGQHEVPFEIPEETYQKVDDHFVRVIALKIEIIVVGLVLRLPGKVSAHHLRKMPENQIDRSQIDVQFDRPSAGRQELVTVTSEEQLEKEIMRPAAIRIVRRVPLPRINFWNHAYWPPSKRVAQIIEERMRAFESGQIPDPRPFDFWELEGPDLETAFEDVVPARIHSRPAATEK